MHQEEQELLSVWEGWHWHDNKGRWLDSELCARQGERKWSTSVATRCTQESPEKCAYARQEGHPSRQDRQRLTRDNQGSPTSARGGSRRNTKTHARPQLYTPTPPLEALRDVLSEIATGTRGGKVVALVDVRRAYCYAPARRRVFVELPPEDYQPIDEHRCGLLQYSLYGTRDAAQNWAKELALTLSDLKIVEEKVRARACGQAAAKARTLWQLCTETTSQSVENDQRWNSSSKMNQESTRSRNK